jgi:hypothetical protein
LIFRDGQAEHFMRLPTSGTGKSPDQCCARVRSNASAAVGFRQFFPAAKRLVIDERDDPPGHRPTRRTYPRRARDNLSSVDELKHPLLTGHASAPGS